MKVDNRIERIEDKLDKVQHDVIEMRIDMKHMLPKIEEHIAGDKKIINELIPVLEKLPLIVEIAEIHQFQELKKKERNLKVKYWSTRLGLISIIIGGIAGITKILGITLY